MRALLRKYPRFFLWSTLVASAPAAPLPVSLSAITVDSLSYGDIAKNWLQPRNLWPDWPAPAPFRPTLASLATRPFLAAIFAIFGMEHYRAALAVQLFVDIGTCFLIADLARRLLSERAAKVAFLLAALCPFFANYAAAALTETLEIFFTVAGSGSGHRRAEARVCLLWIGCGLSISAAILLRPDGGLLLAAIGAYLLWLFLDGIRKRQPVGHLVMAAVLRGNFRRRSANSLDATEPSRIPQIPTAGPTLRQRSQRVCPSGIQSLGQDLDRRLRFGGRNLLASTRPWRLIRPSYLRGPSIRPHSGSRR